MQDERLSSLEKELRIRGYSQETIRNYIFSNKRFLEFIKNPKEEVKKTLVATTIKNSRKK